MLWRIANLYLKNFIHIYSGMGKYEIYLDLTKDPKTINIFIGKMGSGKSSILGHLQPFARYGTLDIRNQDDLILPDRDGIKKITFIHNKDIYEITHNYTWNKGSKTHNIKSYIKLNNEELNENGNTKSFKEIIRKHFGIDQNFLRILRLGPNVSNLINMKSTERKTFVSSLIKDTEVYLYLYQKLAEDYRNINSTLSVLSGKLLSANNGVDEKTLNSQLSHTKEILDDYKAERDVLQYNITKDETIISTIKEKYKTRTIDDIKYDIENKYDEYDEIINKLNLLGDSNNENISIEYGKNSNLLITLEEKMLKCKKNYDNAIDKSNKLQNTILTLSNNNQYDTLKKNFSIIENEYNDIVDKLNNFTCKYNYDYLINFNAQLDQFNVLLEEICSYSDTCISIVYKSDGKDIYKRKELINKLIRIKDNMMRNVDNYKFSLKYEKPIPLFIPPGCPTKDCPFILSHPEYIRLTNNKAPINEYQEKIRKIEDDINFNQNCLELEPRMKYFKSVWESIKKVLFDLNINFNSNISEILFNPEIRHKWFNYNEFINVLEKVKLLDSFNNIKMRYLESKNELLQFNTTDIMIANRDYDEIKIKIKEYLDEMVSINKEIVDAKDKQKIILKQMDLLKNKQELEEKRKSLIQEIKDLQIKYKEALDDNAKIENINKTLNEDKNRLKAIDEDYNNLSILESNLTYQLREIKSIKSSYEETLEERNVIKLILDAVSAKEGIPLILVKMFLSQCKDIVNDLINDIFEDNLEILDFDISEDKAEFKIPYLINGSYVPDVELASQGQQAVISIALSFALCRKSMFDYNIMLLDEIDNSIYKSDRERFIMLLLKQLKALNSEQCFLITHNDIFQGMPVNIIMTTNESIDLYKNQSCIELYNNSI